MVTPLLLMVLSCVIIWRSSDGFEVASDYLGRRLTAGIKGATINAIASSMPEFLTTLFFLFYLRDPEGFSGGLGVASGSALFNLLIIPSLAVMMFVSISRGTRVQLNKRVLLREGLVLLVSQVVFISFLFRGELVGIHGLFLVLIYLLYLGLLFFITRSKRMADPGYTLHAPKRELKPWTRMVILDITHLILPRQKINRRSAWLLLMVSTLIMTFGTWLLVYATDRFGETTGIPLIFVAVVLSAAATSVPDTIISIKDARKGNYDDAVSNALGSNIFDIAFALGFPILLYNLIYRDSMPLLQDVLKFTQEVWAFLLIATIVALIIMLTGRYFNRVKAFLLLLIYVVFLLFVGTQVTGLQEGIGKIVGDFFSEVALWIGRILH
jgi:Ca2+/Na+ antiporter